VTNLEHAVPLSDPPVPAQRQPVTSSVRQDLDVISAALAPSAGEQGVLSSDPTAAGTRALACWDAMIALAEKADLQAVARAKGRLGREVLLPLGRWPQTRSLAQVLADARAGRTLPPVDLEREEREVLAAQAGASDTEVVDALRRTRDDLAGFLGAAPETNQLGQPTASPLGPLPVLTLLHAIAYQLAVCALDLEPCGAAPPTAFLEMGVVALVDVTGALAARQGVHGSITAVMPGEVWGFAAQDGAWRTARLTRPVGRPDGPAVQASARVILDITSGRNLNVPGLWRDGSLVTHDLAGLSRLTPVLEQVPGIPGGTALRAASKAFSGVGRILGRLPGWPL
jgi:hypothetical protein